jgi:hypothetical protein
MSQLSDYLFTLDVCRRLLPPDADPIHATRLDEIEAFVRQAIPDQTYTDYLDTKQQDEEHPGLYERQA